MIINTRQSWVLLRRMGWMGALPWVFAVLPAQDLAGFSQALQDLTERVRPSVVEVLVTSYGPSPAAASAAGLLSLQRSGGSGVLLSPDGYIITNAHVVAGARRVRVVLPLRPLEQPGQSILNRV